MGSLPEGVATQGSRGHASVRRSKKYSELLQSSIEEEARHGQELKAGGHRQASWSPPSLLPHTPPLLRDFLLAKCMLKLQGWPG